MRVQLKGINTVKKRLANGVVETYRYAWKGGPRLVGAPGTPEFIASYNAAVATRPLKGDKLLHSLVDKYLDAKTFTKLAPATKKSYLYYLKIVCEKFGDMPISALEDRRVRGVFLEWRDQYAEDSPRSADFAFQVLARVFAFSYDRGLITHNPCQRPGRVYRSKRSEIVWSEEDESAFYAHAPHHLHLALILGLWTGQRQGDLLALTWSQYDGTQLRFLQHKTKARVVIPVGSVLKKALDRAFVEAQADYGVVVPSTCTILRTARSRRAWTDTGFRASWGTACRKAGIQGKTFHDLRGTAVTRLAVAGCTVAEIATITGHALRDVSALLDAHYLSRDQRLATSAIQKLEANTATAIEPPVRSPRARKAKPEGKAKMMKRMLDEMIGRDVGGRGGEQFTPN